MSKDSNFVFQTEDGIIRSPFTKAPYEEDANESLTDFMFKRLNKGLKNWGDKPFIVDVTAGTSVKFCDLEDQSRRVASALSRRGFKQNDVLYFVTYEMAQLYAIEVAVWSLGGAVRGTYKDGAPEEYVRQLQEIQSSFIVCDAETSDLMREVISHLDWSVELLSVGDATVAGATSFKELLQDDESAFPQSVIINTKECVVTIPTTSGSTGPPKGVLHTHYSAKAFLKSVEDIFPTTSLLESMITNAIGSFAYGIHAICSGLTIYHVGNYEKETFFELLLKYKPRTISIYSYVAAWMAKCSSELARVRKADFLDAIWVGGWMVDPTTAALLGKELPRTDIRKMYGLSETMFITQTDEEIGGKFTSIENDGEICVSSGKLFPYAEAKVVDIKTGKSLPVMQLGEILIRTPSLMKGYLVPGQKPNRSNIDDEEFFHTTDIGLFDDNGNIYIKERLTFMFKYFQYYISPSELESVLQSHPAVQTAGVVGVPHPECSSLTHALVVLRPELSATCDELRDFVAQRVPSYKHLHGGVSIVDSLPRGRNGKMDRNALKKLALKM